MSTNWSINFFKPLSKYVKRYIKARGDPVARAKILKKCGKVIAASALQKEQDLELPENLCYVSISFCQIYVYATTTNQFTGNLWGIPLSPGG
jgi:hypothetical protein